jgi:folate-binding protein YgfZ
MIGETHNGQNTTRMSSYEAAHTGVAVRRRRDRGILGVTGKDRLAWLQGLVTNDVAFAGPGTCYAAWLTPHGRMITDMTVVETGDETWLDVPASLAPSLALRLDQLIFTEDARVSDLSDELVGVGVYGAGALAAIGPVFPGETVPPAIGAGSESSVWRGPGRSLAVQATEVGAAGFHLYLDNARASALEGALAQTGAVLDDETATVLRVEAGVPAFLVDMGEETIPLEANLDRALSQTKGCYVGQEIIVRIRDRAHGRVARRLVGLLPDGGAVPRAGQTLTSEGRHAGRLTSAVMSPSLGRPIALATLLRDFTEAGTTVILEDDTRALVTSLPFVAPPA